MSERSTRRKHLDSITLAACEWAERILRDGSSDLESTVQFISKEYSLTTEETWFVLRHMRFANPWKFENLQDLWGALSEMGLDHGFGDHDEAIRLLRDVLHRARDLSDAYREGIDQSRQAYRRLVEAIHDSEVPGLATWFIHVLNHWGLICPTSQSITERGSELLQLLEEHWQPKGRRRTSKSDVGC